MTACFIVNKDLGHFVEFLDKYQKSTTYFGKKISEERRPIVKGKKEVVSRKEEKGLI